MDKIFLLGSERSGSNLLRTLLGNHSKISAPIAPHLCDTFYNSYEKYIELENGIDILINDLETYVNHDFNDWGIPKGYFKTKQIGNFINFIEFYNHCFTLKAKYDKKDVYFSKDNHIHNYALGIKSIYSDAKFIYLYRDPRDQVASWMRTPLHLHTPYQAINKWVKEQRIILKLKNFYGLEIYSIKYEELVDNTNKVMTGLLKYLNLHIEESCFQTRHENKEALKHSLWSNINKPVMKSNYGKFNDILSNEDVRMIETIANKEMKKLNYSSESTEDWEKGNMYLFYLKEKYLVRKSKKENKQFVERQMKILGDKHRLKSKMFEKL